MENYGWEQHGLNQEKCVSFIEKNQDHLNLLVRLFENTKYYKTSDVLDGIKIQILKWKSERKDIPLYLPIPNIEIGSEIWLYNLFKDLLPEHQIMKNITDIPTEIEVELLLIDDWCLSGFNLLGTFDQLFYILGRNPDGKYNFTTTVITFVCTNTCRNNINGVCRSFRHSKSDFKFYCQNIVDSLYEHVKDIPEQQIIDFMIKYMPNIDPVPELLPFPVHFEHKIANQFGSYPLIYKPCRNDVIKPYKSKEN